MEVEDKARSPYRMSRMTIREFLNIGLFQIHLPPPPPPLSNDPLGTIRKETPTPDPEKGKDADDELFDEEDDERLK